MFALSRLSSRLFASLFLSAFFSAAATQPSSAQGTHLWTQSTLDEFEKGAPEGVAIASDGHLRQAPGLAELATTPSTFVWSVAADKDGTTYVGTGSPATVLRIGKDGKPFTLFESKDLSVQVVRLAPDGTLLAATMPSGKVYSLDPRATSKQDDSSAKVVFDLAKTEAAKDSSQSKTEASKPRYIWDLTYDAEGRLYIATGGPGSIYRVTAGSPPELFFKSDEAHIRTLALDAKGNLIAGTDGTGLVYRISPEGKGYVVFEAPRREVTSVAVGADGTIYAACVGDKSRNPLPPLPVQGTATATITIVQPGSLREANASASIPEGTEIYALREGEAPRKLWASKDDIVYALAAQKDGLLAVTGNHGRIFRIAADGSYADIGHLGAQQGLSLAAAPGSENIFIGTGNTGKLFRLGAAGRHEYASDVLDASAFARFGRIEVEPGSAGYELFTRTGNIEQPVRGWSDWQPLKDGVAASPAGRFLQWKAVLQPGGELGSVGVNYLPVNTAPVVDELVVVPGARINSQNSFNSQQTVSIAFPSAAQSGISFDGNSVSQPLQGIKDRASITARWAANDDDGDDLSYSLYLRGDGETVWRLLKDKLTEKAWSFDATLVPDGGYRIRVVASDAPSHTPGDALTGEKVSDRFVVDTTPPVITALKASAKQTYEAFSVEFDAEDSASPIAHAEYSLDAGPWQYIEPVGKISDSLREHFSFVIQIDADTVGKTAEHLVTVRAYDRYDNAGVAKAVISAGEKK